jgi:cbb3-type cytochrome oxidase subunit 3
MTKRPSTLQIGLVVIFSFLTIAFGILFLKRRGLAYNSEGRFYDEAQSVVYHEQSVIPILLIALLLFGLFMATLAWIFKTVKK